ncbi:hypothetical protein KV692_21165 [Xanthomonas euvesicatoria pv. physalidis]|uniref:hypothetical protein n=3 Tax=Xanthomonas TaxID=338 RepID=UPI001C496872|nr:hypothetical protein [Xanthomonas euvesicatoria]MBV6690289.1 hypothetical protein [Xanthomonas euvesicatoria pv. physalidis]MBV6889613.1 hypothetical protein [Xanthomonas campestris pv. spermacoces]
MKTIPTRRELQQIVDLHVLQIVSVQDGGTDGGLTLLRLHQEFEDEFQPLLADKPYTALQRTYKQWLMVGIENHYSPGSASLPTAVRVSSIRDSEVVHRRNRLALNEELWSEYLEDIRTLAAACVEELVQAIRAGKETDQLVVQHNLAAAQLGIDYGFTEAEDRRDLDSFRNAYTAELERHTHGAA